MEKISLLFIVSFLCIINISAQNYYTENVIELNKEDLIAFHIKDFSDEYYAIVEINRKDLDEVFKTGQTTIYDKKNNEKIIRIVAEELTFDLENNEIQANILEHPYGEQSVLIYDDFNFDGKNDFAIMDGYYSCYHGPSFEIYLKTENGFEYSPEFSELSHDYCGMFDYNSEAKTLNTWAKSGCCWHQTTEHTVVDNKPFAIRITETSFLPTGYSEEIIKSEWNGKEMINTSKLYLVDVPSLGNIVLSFDLAKNGKKVYLIEFPDNSLNYVIVNSKNEIELDYFHLNENPEFEYHDTKSETTLSFKNENAKYQIYQTKTASPQFGIKVFVDKKIYDYKALEKSVKGNLNMAKEFDNITYKSLKQI